MDMNLKLWATGMLDMLKRHMNILTYIRPGDVTMDKAI